MKTKFPLSVRFSLTTLLILAVVTVVYFFSYRAFYTANTQYLFDELNQTTEKALEHQLIRKGLSIGKILSDNLFNPVYTLNLDHTYQLIKPVIALEEVKRIYVIDSDGLIFHDGTKNLEEFGLPHPNVEAIEQAVTQKKTVVLDALSGPTDQERLVVILPIAEGHVVVGSVFIELGPDTLHQDNLTNRRILEKIQAEGQESFLLVQLVVLLISVVLGLSLAILLSKSLTRPLNTLINHFNQNEDYHKDIPKFYRDDEIGALSDAYNQMSAKINRKNEAIRHLAFHDTLTQLPNRSKFTEHLEALLKATPRHSVHLYFIDLDEFKWVNDTFGHSHGDALLNTIASRLTYFASRNEAVINPDTAVLNMVSRIGGDEFVIAIVDLDASKEDLCVQEILKQLREPIQIENELIQAGGSVGVVLSSKFDCSANELIKYADMAMYRAKDNGKNAYVEFSESMRQHFEHQAIIEKELHLALNDLSQFEFWYQPKIDLNSGKLIGAEALVRWSHPERGYIFPDQFIPIAESSDVILKIGEHLIEQAIIALKSWLSQNKITEEFHVAINLSARQIYRQNLPRILRKITQKHGVPAKMLQLEVTESLLLNDTEKANQVLTKLQKLGHSVWLDDFGTGYSSLSYMQRFNFNGVKVDRSFVNDIESNDKNFNLVNAIASLAEGFGIETVAEGIENKEQSDIVAALGCTIGQGYYFAKPVPRQQFEDVCLVPEKLQANHTLLFKDQVC
jgi:diguanylate cyclase (GGDEF)-like protein